MNVLRSLRNRLLAGLFLLLMLFLALVFAGVGSLRAVNRAVESELTTLAAGSDLATDLVGFWRWLAATGVLIAAILLPAGFFFSAIGNGRTSPNRWAILFPLGAVVLAAGVVTLAVGLLTA